MPVKPPQTPLAVLVAGGLDEQERYRQVLETGLPGISLRARAAAGHDGADIEDISTASAESHFAIVDGTDHSLENLHSLFDAVITTDDDLKRFLARAKNFERRRRTHQLPPDIAPIMSPWSPTWASTVARIGARVARIFAGHSIDAMVDHIGSTSVPGLAAKNIIDLQVSVADLDMIDWCDIDLRNAGFVNVQELAPDSPGVSHDNARGMITSPYQWQKRLYAGVDEAQRVIVHVRRTGAANWRYALLFRDWLRANDSWRDDYAATKVHLAEKHANDSHFDDYARAKDFWFDRAYDIAEEWARTTQWTAPAPMRHQAES